MKASASRIPPSPPLTVEYDCRGRRVRKTFDDAYAARRWFTAKDAAGKNPRIISSQPDEKPRNTIPKKTVAAYVRVSTVGQNEAGQRAEIEKWLTGNGIEPSTVTWFVDKTSGDKLKRPAFEELQAAVFSGKVQSILDCCCM